MLERDLTPYEAGYLYTLGHIAATRTEKALMLRASSPFLCGENFVAAKLRDEFFDATKAVSKDNTEEDGLTYKNGVAATKTHLKKLLEEIHAGKGSPPAYIFPGARSEALATCRVLDKFDGVPVHKLIATQTANLTGSPTSLFRGIWEYADRYYTEQTNQ